MIHRRGLITGLGVLFIAAPAIVRASSLMSIRAIDPIYGRSPALEVLQAFKDFEAHRAVVAKYWESMADLILPRRHVADLMLP